LTVVKGWRRRRPGGEEAGGKQLGAPFEFSCLVEWRRNSSTVKNTVRWGSFRKGGRVKGFERKL